MTFKLALHLFLLVACLVLPRLTSARNLHVYKPSRLLFPKHLEGSRKGDNIEGIHNVKAYLQRYGYLNKSKTNSSHTDAFDDDLECAVKAYQTFFKLNVSGVLDERTIYQLVRPRCGVTDNFRMGAKNGSNVEEMGGGGGSYYSFFPLNRKWPRFKVHLTYGFIHNYPPEYVPAVRRAIETWQTHTRFSFSLAARVQTADILFSMESLDHGDGWPFDGLGGILGHCFGPMDGRIHFDADEPWSESLSLLRYDLESVALHELGHALGLGHSTDETAVMWPDLDSGLTKIHLQPDDLAGIRALYP